MAHKLVCCNGKIATYSTIADGFISSFEEKDIKNLKETPIPIEEVMVGIVLNRTFDEAKDVLLESGLSIDETHKLLNDTYEKLYKPIKLDNGEYECPNCGDKIQIGQKTCLNETCEIDFIW